jgi:cold shock CspA family protein
LRPKDFCFIARDDGQADLFFHVNGVAREFVETIDIGSRVTFDGNKNLWR